MKIRLSSLPVRWIVAGAALLIVAAAAAVLLCPGMPLREYIRYRTLSGRYASIGVLESELGDLDEPVTRVAFSQIIGRAYGVSDMSRIAYDLSPPDGTAEHGEFISRRQAAQAMAALLLLPPGGGEAPLDADEIGEDALPAALAAVERGLLGLDAGLFRPQDPLIARELLVMLETAVGTAFNEAGTYTSGAGGVIRGNVTISAADTALCDADVTGDVVIAPGVGTGAVTLDNVRIGGRLLLMGAQGGVLLSNVTCPESILSAPEYDPLRLVAMGETQIDAVSVLTGAALEENQCTGEGFMNISVSGAKARAELRGSADGVEMSGEGSALVLPAGSFARNVVLWTPSDILGEGDVTTLTLHDGPVLCEVLPETTDILTSRTVRLAGWTFTGDSIKVSGDDILAVSRDTAALAIGFSQGDEADHVTGDLALPTRGEHGSRIEWKSDNEEHITAAGAVTRADYPLGDRQVTLTAVISRGNISQEWSCTLTVLQKEITPRQSVEADAAAIEIGYGAGDSQSGIIHDLVLPTSGANGTTITWESSSPSALDASGKVNRTTSNRTVTLTATVTKEDAVEKREFKIVVKKKIAFTDEQRIEEDKDTLRIVFAPGDSAGAVTQSLLLPGSGVNGSVVTWASSHPAIVTAGGAVTRPVAASGNQTVKLTATLSLGGRKTTKTFQVVVLALEPTPTPTPTATPTPAPTATPTPPEG
ncbi:MAG: hypothetical protein GX549_09225 [Clostridiales bacterium]|nr:hypothetical protein [Clostridiales bacterium]